MAPGDLQVRVVLDREDSPKHADLLRRLSDPVRGTVLCSVTPGSRSLASLATDVLRGLGKRSDVRGARATQDDAWRCVAAWVAGEGITELLVSRSHLLPRNLWERLIELSAQTATSLWLFVQGATLNRGQRECIRDWPIERWTFADFEQHVRRCSPQPSPKAAATACDEPFPHVPEEEFPTFLATCRALLAPSAFATVADVYWDTYRGTNSWFATASNGRTQVDVLDLARQIATTIRGCDDTSEVLVRLRGTQAAALLHSYLIKVRPDALAGAYVPTPLSAVTAQRAARLRIYSRTRYPAAAALSLTTRQSPRVLSTLNVEDVAPDGSRVELADESFEVSPHLSGVLRAHVAYRLSLGAMPDEPLFISEKRSNDNTARLGWGRTTAHGIQQQLRTVAQETGLAVAATDGFVDGDVRRWLKRRGVTVHALATGSTQAC
jgi:hypothetical protein